MSKYIYIYKLVDTAQYNHSLRHSMSSISYYVVDSSPSLELLVRNWYNGMMWVKLFPHLPQILNKQSHHLNYEILIMKKRKYFLLT